MLRRVKEKETGRVFEIEAVDARELVDHEKGEYEYAGDHEAVSPVVASGKPAKPAKEQTAAERLAALSVKELKALVKKSNLKTKAESKADLVKALTPHVEAGTIALDGPPPLKAEDIQDGKVG